MAAKQMILFSTLILGATSNIGLAMKNNSEQSQKIRFFDQGWHTNLNTNNGCDLFLSLILENCNQNNDITIVKKTGKNTRKQGTIKSFKDTYLNENTPNRSEKLAVIKNFWNHVEENNALFDPRSQTIIYGNEKDINDLYIKREKELEAQNKPLQLYESIFKSCKQSECKELESAINNIKEELKIINL